jgi:hypothetical protein
MCYAVVTCAFLCTFVHFFALFCAFGAGAGSDSSIAFFHFALWGNNYRQGWADFLTGHVVCFAGFSDGAEIWGLDRGSMLAAAAPQ